MIGFRYLSSRWRSPAALQWAPTLTAHDPNPPLVLEDPAGGTITYTYAGTGGITLSGAATLAKTKAAVASGGLTIAGSGEISRARVYAVSGGITIAGSGEVSKSKTFTASGGLVIGGSAPINLTHTPAVSGGKLFGGTAPTSYTPAGGETYTYTPTGGFTFSGSGSAEKADAETPSETGTSGGEWFQWRRNKAPKKQNVRECNPSGGMRFGGRAPVSRTRAHRATIKKPRGRIGGNVSRTISVPSRARLKFSGRSRCLHVPSFGHRQKLETARKNERMEARGAATLRQRRKEEELAILLAILK